MSDIRRRRVLITTGALVLAPRVAGAQPSGRVFRIGYLSGGSGVASRQFPDAFRQGLLELGWVEGRNVVIDYRFAEGRLDELPALAADLVRRKVDVILAAPSPSAAAAKNATSTIPVVMCAVGFPVELGFVASLSRPGGNITGVAFSAGTEIFGKGLELLKEVLPDLQRVAVLSNPGNPGHALALSNAKEVARSVRLQLSITEARDRNGIDAAFAAMAKERVSAVLVVTDPVFIAQRAHIAALAAESRRPAVYTIRDFVDVGGLMSYGPNLLAQYRRAAVFVDRILRGAKPGELPVEQPTVFELVINVGTAKALGLSMPRSLLLRADHVVE